MHIDVSVIIVSWNVRNLLRVCLNSLFKETKDIRFEVILIDNVSTDGSASMVVNEFPEVTLIENKVNRGFAAACNQGVKIARGNYILLLNPDTVVIDGAVQKTVSYADEHSDAGVVGCQVLLNDTEIQKTCFSYPSIAGLLIQKTGLRRVFSHSRLFGWIDYGWWDRTTEKEVDVVSGMYMLVRREVIASVGLLDEAYFVYAEETDWCYRIKKAGWKIVFTPSARIIHIDGGNKSTDLVKIKMFVQMQKSLLIFYKKNYGFFSWLLAKIIYTISMLLRYISFKILSFVKNTQRVQNKVEQASAAIRFHIFAKEPK